MCGQPPAPLHLVPAGGWITKPPPRLLGTTAGARLCLSGHAELSLGGGGGGGGTTGDPWHSTGSPGEGERKRQGCAAHVSVPQFHPGMLARRLRDGAAGRAGVGGGADGTWGHSCHTRPAQPAPPAGLSEMGTWHIGPGGCMGGTCGAAERRWCTEESGAVRWGQSRSRCPRVGSAVLVAGGARRRGGGRGRGCNPSNARYFPGAAARASPRLQRGWNAVSEPRHGGCNPPHPTGMCPRPPGAPAPSSRPSSSSLLCWALVFVLAIFFMP